MNRLEKKCVLAAAGFHLLLLLVLLVGPAFLSSRDQPDNLPVIDFIPFKTVDAMVSGGGNPNAKPPAPAPLPQPAAPAAPPAPKAVPPPEVTKLEPARKETVKETPKETKVDPDALEPAKDRKRKVDISTTLVKRRPYEFSESKARADAQARERAAEARRQTTAAISQAVRGIQSGLSSGTTIELKGPGGGGVPYANWKQAVKSVYDAAWILPAGITADSATTAVTVTIARDGTVISARIVDRSGSAVVDQSVQAALDRVKYAAPLPDDAKEDQRTITIYFDVKAKLLG
ncbi:MAG: TonB family protein [Verrucomicrobiota bacterium]|jgi:TonB family protein